MRFLCNDEMMATRNRNFEIAITQYAPRVFEHLRSLEGVSVEQLLVSLAPVNNA